MSKASQLGPLNSLSVARISWSIFTKNLQGKLNDAETDYITADKAVGSAQNRSPERLMKRPMSLLLILFMLILMKC
ncbi:hypothetical protein N579_03780 [Corynebacterium pseudodiphtheriticum 090104]|nr:hypothetical protein N579_03780 [Corynebacterium pseudodiphtheriticum 090104]